MLPKPWDRTGAEEVSDFGIFRVRRFLARSPRTGDSRPFNVIDTADWVNVVALTRDREVVLVRQYRHGIEAPTLEIPGGMIDPGESPVEAAGRELREETGYAGEDPVLLGVVEPNPAILSNRCSTVLLRNAVQVDEPRPDPGEDILVARLSLADIPGAIADGRIAHSLVICAFWWVFHADVTAGDRPPEAGHEEV